MSDQKSESAKKPEWVSPRKGSIQMQTYCVSCLREIQKSGLDIEIVYCDLGKDPRAIERPESLQ